MEKIKTFFGEINYGFISIRDFISNKMLDNLILAILYLSLISISLYTGWILLYEIYHNFTDIPEKDSFPFILQFAEDLFLYFLPIFILSGFISYYKNKLRSIIGDDKNDESENAEESIHITKKLFFSSVLSYCVIKIIDLLFFNFEKIQDNNIQIISIGAFLLILVIFVVIQHSPKHDKKENDK